MAGDILVPPFHSRAYSEIPKEVIEKPLKSYENRLDVGLAAWNENSVAYERKWRADYRIDSIPFK
jgi:hypothetical protein